MLAGVIARHPEIVDFSWGKDAELDAALLLAGVVRPSPELLAARGCFQTTYLNECYHEYVAHEGAYSLIWLIRNPHSVVYSMVYNWRRFALNEVFEACGAQHLGHDQRLRYLRRGPRAVRAVERACWSYIGKARQALELAQRLSRDSILFLEYETLVREQASSLEAIGEFAGLSMNGGIGSGIRSDSLAKASRLSAREADVVQDLCAPVYAELRRLVA